MQVRMPSFRKKGTAKKPMAMKKGFKKFFKSARRRYPTLASRGWRNNGQELKGVDLVAANGAIDTTGTITCLNAVAVGDDINTRDGRQIDCHSVHVYGSVGPVATTSSAQYCRVMLVWDSQPNSAAAPAITDILAAGTSYNPSNLNNRQRFTILRDFKETLGGISTVATQTFAMSPTCTEIDWFVPLKGLKTTYSGTTANVNVIATGSLLCVTIGSVAAGTGHTFIYTARFRFMG